MSLDLAQTGALRSPDTVMRLSRLGSFHQSRLSFMRTLLRKIGDGSWTFSIPLFEISTKGVGTAIYQATGPDRTYSLICFSHDLDPAKRSDRVIAEEWDATFTLFDGVPAPADIERLRSNVPKQEAGRIRQTELALSRANRSVRLFNYVRECLANGRQPEAAELDKVGYLMRTTAVYGSGKFGACDRRFIADRSEFNEPFQVELLAVYLIRAFTIDIVEHLALQDAPGKAVKLDPALKRRLGVGNSTGLGMAPFLVNHPALLNNWIMSREVAIARVRNLDTATSANAEKFVELVRRQQITNQQWSTDHEEQAERVCDLHRDLTRLLTWLDQTGALTKPQPWNAVYEFAAAELTLEAQECIASLMLEPHAELVDELTAGMSANEDEVFAIDGTMALSHLKTLLRERYDFARRSDYNTREDSARFWYVSEEKLEPRLGERYEEDGSELENPLATGRDAQSLRDRLEEYPDDISVAEFVLKHPEHRHSVRRAQISEKYPFAEIRDNLIANDMLPIDLLRCKLSFFGAVKFDPRSDRWVRITMYQHAPFPAELSASNCDDWIYPSLQSLGP